MTTDTRDYSAALDYCVQQTRANLGRLDAFPHTTRNGLWRTSDHGRWTAGHWIGVIWLAYLRTGDADLIEAAYRWAARLEPRKDDTSTHDMGFLFYPSFVRGYRITGDRWFRDAAIDAAHALATRFHTPGNYIQAWDEAEDPAHRGRTIVDTVMNLPLLLWAAKEDNAPALAEVAVAVAEMTARQHVREDGSTWHVVDFDPDTGEPLRRGTHQGLRDDSCWTRGQAWAIYGFSSVGRMAKRPDLQRVARRLADYFVERTPSGSVPPWDFDATGPDVPRDSAAGAIAANGLLDLAVSAGDSEVARLRNRQAREMLDALVSGCLSVGHDDQQGILMHAIADLPRHSAVDESLMYGDHYFFEALMRVAAPSVVEPLLA